MRAVLAVPIALALVVPQPAATTKPERFSAIMTAGPLNPRPIAIEIGVDRWSTDETRANLFDIFQAGGQMSLLDKLKKEKIAGYLRAPERERLQAAYVQAEARPGGGRRVLLLCIRYHGDWEVVRDAGWTEYPFRIVALTLDPADRGTGMLFHAASVTFRQNGPDLVSELSGQPTKLLSVQKVR